MTNAKQIGGRCNGRGKPYGVKRDYKKIDIYRRTTGGLEYLASTTWARTCREACERYTEERGLDLSDLRAFYSR